MRSVRCSLALLLCLVPMVALAESPKLKIDDVKVLADPGKPATRFLEVKPETDAASIVYLSLDGLTPIPAAWSNDALAFRVDLNGVADGKYRIIAVAAGKDGSQARADFSITKGTPEPPKPPIPPNPLEAKAKAVVAPLKGFKPQAQLLGDFYASWVISVGRSNFKTVGEFGAAHGNELKAFVARTGYAGAPKVGVAVDAYIGDALGIQKAADGWPDGPLDKAKLVDALEQLTKALRSL
jgi:hypothetical protein